ncbi:MAG TPA: glycosyltransferase, partial [Gemmataceae bacterium]|nr:glycosyltransferase [Gemmataceae bacterium]
LTAGGVNAALEAMAAGRAVVAARVTHLEEIVRDGETGFLFAPGDKVALARQVRVLLEDSGLRWRCGQAGHDRARAHFAATELVRRFSHLYAALSPPSPALV